MWYRWHQAIFRPPFTVVCFNKWSKEPYVLAIGVVKINLCECALVGIREREWPRMWDMGMGRRLNGRGASRLSVSRINAQNSSLRDRKWDRHIRSPFCQVTSGLRCGFRNAKRNRAQKSPNVLQKPLCLATIVVPHHSIVFGVKASLREAFGGLGGGG